MSMTVRGLEAYGTSRHMVTAALELDCCLDGSERCTRRAVAPAFTKEV